MTHKQKVRSHFKHAFCVKSKPIYEVRCAKVSNEWKNLPIGYGNTPKDAWESAAENLKREGLI
jgi:hypothetical protein